MDEGGGHVRTPIGRLQQLLVEPYDRAGVYQPLLRETSPPNRAAQRRVVQQTLRCLRSVQFSQSGFVSEKACFARGGAPGTSKRTPLAYRPELLLLLILYVLHARFAVL